MKLAYGTIVEQNLTGDTHQYRVKLSTGALSPWMPSLVKVAGDTKHNVALSLNTQVAALLGDYDGLILGALNSSAQPAVTSSDTVERTVYKDGAVIEYNDNKHALKAILPSGATTELVSDGSIKITGDIDLMGNLTQTGDFNQIGMIQSSGDHIANGVSVHNHVHAGDSGGITGTPQ